MDRVLAIANSIAFSNLHMSLSKVDEAIRYVADFGTNQTTITNLTATDFPASVDLFNDLGLAFQDVICQINQEPNNTAVWVANLYQTEMTVFYNLLGVITIHFPFHNKYKSSWYIIQSDTLDALPDQSSLLYAQLYQYISVDTTNTTIQETILNYPNFLNIYSNILKDRGSSALWLYPAAVCFTVLTRY